MFQDLSDTNKIAGAIIIAGIIIALGIMIEGGELSSAQHNENVDSVVPTESTFAPENLSFVTERDHVRGSLDPVITIYEFSDFECPFCKQFHDTMQKVMDEFGDEVQWVFRHYPIPNLHQKAITEAIASECAYELAGPEGFWFFADRFFELSPSNDRTDLEVVFPLIAEELGVNEAEFLSCVEERRHISKIERDMSEARTTGGEGTPWSIVVSSNGDFFPIPGHVPFESLKPAIENLLKE